MRTATYLKWLTPIVALTGSALCWWSEAPLTYRLAGVLLSVTTALLLRLMANLGQMVYEWYHGSSHALTRIQRELAQMRRELSDVRMLETPERESSTDARRDDSALPP